MRNDSNDSGATLAIGIVLGAVVGAGLALLLAPGTGRETRQRLADAGERLGNAARNRFDGAGEIANDIKNDIKRNADSLLHEVKGSIDSARG